MKVDDDTVPIEFALDSNYPNPFNPGTMISFSINQNSNVRLDIYDVRGSIIESLINRNLTNGSHQYYWDASQNSSGVYFVRLMVDGVNKTQKVMLMK